MELSLVAVERVKEYSEEIEQEAPAIIEPRPAPTWPAKGAIMVDKLSIRYAEDLPDVLHEVSFSVQAGEKIGKLVYLVCWLRADICVYKASSALLVAESQR